MDTKVECETAKLDIVECINCVDFY